MQVISLGGGLQSSTLILMSVTGELDPPAKCAVFADTGWERGSTYEYVKWLTEYCRSFDFPIYWLGNTNIRIDMLSDKQHYDHMPLFTDTGTSIGQLKRQCTNHYKIVPIRRFIRNTFGFQPYTLWLGFSTDEVVRCRPSRVKYITHRFPLIENRMNRQDCERWLLSHDFSVPVKSSCIGCPYRNDREWHDMKTNNPLEFEDVVSFDDQIRDKHLHKSHMGYPLYIHRSCSPLKDITFDNPDQLNLFEQEDCEGGCWV